MSDSTMCRRCGASIHPSSPVAGVCERCLVRAGLEDPASELEGTSAGAEPEAAASTLGARRPNPEVPPVSEIAPAFPQLEILEPIGRGGMGIVYRARHRRLDRAVALKILPANLQDNASFTARFEREARALARLDHPNVVTVFDAGRAGSRHYLVMEFVEGVNLRRLMEAGPLTPREALSIVPQICDALQYAHDRGVVHRDIKPENVLVDREGRVKITDFGLAKLFDTPGSGSVTASRLVMGTPHYMAPEQIERPREVDHRADLYSLGVVFYEMLTGELPLGRFEPPSNQARVDRRLDPVVLRALAKSPEDRYQRASDIREDVSEVADHPARDADSPDRTAPSPADDRAPGGGAGRHAHAAAPPHERPAGAGTVPSRPESWNGILDAHVTQTWAGLWLAACVLVAASWNFGTWGLVAASAGATALYLVGMARTRRTVPFLRGTADSPGTLLRRASGAVATLAFGSVPLLLTTALYRLGEVGRIEPARRPSPRPFEPEAWAGPAERLGLELAPGAVQLLRSQIGEGALGVDPRFPALILLGLGLALLLAACCHVFERPGVKPSWRTTLQPGLQVWALAVAAGLFVILVPGQVRGLELEWTDSGLPIPMTSSEYGTVTPVSAEIASDAETVRERLADWMEARGYERHDWAEGRIVSSDDPPLMAPFVRVYMKPASAFERWRFELSGPVRTRPWILLEMVGHAPAGEDGTHGATTPLTIVHASTDLAWRTGGEDVLWSAELRSLERALSDRAGPGPR